MRKHFCLIPMKTFIMNIPKMISYFAKFPNNAEQLNFSIPFV